MQHQESIHVFPDTNIFLHFAAFDRLDWQSLCGKNSTVQIHISQSLLAELNKLKDTWATSTVGKRAAGAIKTLCEIHKESRSSPSGTTAGFSVSSPNIFRFLRLNPNVQDDHLLTEMRHFAAENSGESVVLATDDGGFDLTVKAGHYGVKWVEPSSAWRLPAEPDPQEAEIQKLRRKNERLHNARPIPNVCFGDGAERFSISGLSADSQSKLHDIM